MSIVIYTANYGRYDRPIPSELVKDIDYIYFSDSEKNEVPYGWKHVNMKMSNSNRLNARYIKCHPPKGYDISIWIDSSVISDIYSHEVVYGILGDYDLACFKHPVRDCLYQEADVCSQLGYAINQNRIDEYRHEGFPENYGLYGSGIIFRKNSPQVDVFNDTWWNEILRCSYRDQISQMYAIWKTGIKHKTIEGSLYRNKFFEIRKHKKKDNGIARSL